MTTPRDFAIALLSGLSVPVTENNIDAMISAQAAEGGFMSTAAEQTAFYNPLNTQRVLNSSIASGYSSSNPIQAYPDWATGLQAAINTLKNGLYGDILASLQASAAPATTLAVWAKNPSYGWSITPAVNTAYGSQVFPQGPSPLPLVVPPTPAFGAMPYLPTVSSVGPSSITSAGVGAVLAYGFWKLYEYLGK